MTYALGDIHGHLDALSNLMSFISPRQKDVIICLGDYIDRGSDSKGVVDYLLEFRKSLNLIHLKGNHEFLLERAKHSVGDMNTYLKTNVGGRITLDSYGGSIDHIPEAHWNFLIHEAKLYHETDTHIYVHGGLDHRYPVSEQNAHTLCWDRFYFPKQHISGKTMICGHTPQNEVPRNVDNSGICIDTGIYLKDGWLTALEVETGKYIQSNKLGDQIRTGSVSLESDDDL